MRPPVVADFWKNLSRTTQARIALGRAGASLPTQEVLNFSLAHARARDAVHTPFDRDKVAGEIQALGFETIFVESGAPDRASYLRRPDWGRVLSPASRALLASRKDASCDLAIVVADGLSATAVHSQIAPLLAAFKPYIARAGWRVAPVVIASQARVALGDEIGVLFGARAVILLVGERPGLSSPDSLGIYLTYDPKPGRNDGERNCISNVRDEGLSHDLAAFKLAWLVDQALKRQLTGVALKDESDELLAADGKPTMFPASSG
ncbi:ethanolamine ammonia-lyase [Methylovirgula ligni]|uniref:Ethanolamine ammonia-lyase small subunit n=1 Tax=Methylovirgula ligni TaxID=569860 RepID=A0A3D9YT47_9HYPH|nr:ethanolamine ammonia-lyase subunit EutC [Methylovirgula ligni]QAY94897.1 ethanolamine ammonia-lyase [Methylovirgula ligni]REF84663.1 ethanolamine ammonia-lyase light chain [Methylovirgula ligni]